MATEIGPRIVGAFFDGSDNLFHIFPETAGQTGGDEWNNYGGHRLWHSPEDKIRTQTIDNFPVDVKDTAKGITLHAGPDANAGIEKTIEISCPEDTEKELTADAPARLDLDARAESSAGDYPAEQMETIRRVHDLLTKDLSSRITIDELSRRFHMNPSSMKALFKAIYGQSIAAHIREHRMEKAAALLRETDESMAEIARAVGYESQSKFTAEFRKTFETLPTEYRRAAKK